MKTLILGDTHIYIDELPKEVESLLSQFPSTIINVINNCSSPRRKREIAASHLIVNQLFGNCSFIEHDENGAPFINGRKEFISITHSATEIAIAINPNKRIGIDIENWRDQLIKVKERFLSPKEIAIYSTSQLMLQAWTTKEALYKIAQSPGISLANDIILPLDPSCNIAKVNTLNGPKNFSFQVIESTPTRCLTISQEI